MSHDKREMADLAAEAFRQLVEAEVARGTPRREAVVLCSERRPDLHARWLTYHEAARRAELAERGHR